MIAFLLQNFLGVYNNVLNYYFVYTLEKQIDKNSRMHYLIGTSTPVTKSKLENVSDLIKS